jgi:hypothetical protein
LRQLSNLGREVVCQLGLDRSRKTGQISGHESILNHSVKYLQ